MSQSLCARPLPVRLTENLEGDVLLYKVSYEVGNTSTVNDQQVHEQAVDGENSETLDREEKEEIVELETYSIAKTFRQRFLYRKRLQTEIVKTIFQIAMST